MYSLEVIGESVVQEECLEDVTTEEDVVNGGDEETENVELCHAVFDPGIHGPYISLNALSGVNSFQTMRVKGMVGKQVLHILIDTGSTHNFLDTKAAKRVGCQMIGTSPLQVSVANGQKLLSTHECPQFVWNMHIHKFVSDVMILPLGGCDMVLGIQWLTTLDDIKWNFKKLVMEFEYKMKKVVLRGTRDITLKWMQGKKGA